MDISKVSSGSVAILYTSLGIEMVLSLAKRNSKCLSSHFSAEW